MFVPVASDVLVALLIRLHLSEFLSKVPAGNGFSCTCIIAANHCIYRAIFVPAITNLQCEKLFEARSTEFRQSRALTKPPVLQLPWTVAPEFPVVIFVENTYDCGQSSSAEDKRCHPPNGCTNMFCCHYWDKPLLQTLPGLTKDAAVSVRVLWFEYIGWGHRIWHWPYTCYAESSTKSLAEDICSAWL